jgi:hypothetical protein
MYMFFLQAAMMVAQHAFAFDFSTYLYCGYAYSRWNLLRAITIFHVSARALSERASGSLTPNIP